MRLHAFSKTTSCSKHFENNVAKDKLAHKEKTASFEILVQKKHTVGIKDCNV